MAAPCPQALGTPLLCWDVGGAAGLRGIWSKYYGECHALVFVVDAADRSRLEEAKAAMDRALGEAVCDPADQTTGLPCCLKLGPLPHL